MPCLLQNFPFIPKYYFICACFLNYFPLIFYSSELSLISVNTKVQQGYRMSFVGNLGTVQMTVIACCGMYFRGVRWELRFYHVLAISVRWDRLLMTFTAWMKPKANQKLSIQCWAKGGQTKSCLVVLGFHLDVFFCIFHSHAVFRTLPCSFLLLLEQQNHGYL